MAEERHVCAKIAADLRAHVLGTLDATRAAEIAAHLETCTACRAALDVETQALAALDALPEMQASQDLTAATLARIHDEEMRKATGARLPWVAVFACASLVIVAGVFLLPTFQRARESSRRVSSVNNLKQMGVIFKMYANESRGEFYPPMAPYDGVWVPDLRVLYPEYLTDVQILVNPRHPNAKRLLKDMMAALALEPPDLERVMRLAARSYTYTAWSVTDVAELEQVSVASRGRVGALRDESISSDSGSVRRLREGVERFLITDINNAAGSVDAQSEIPIMFEVVYAEDDPRRTEGCNVLFMDGHVEFILYGDAFPVLPATAEILPPSPE